MRKKHDHRFPMLFLKSFGAMVFCLCLVVSANLVSAVSPAKMAAEQPLSIDSAQRQEIQSILDSLTAAPEIESIIAGRKRVEGYISTYRQKAARAEKEITQLETALQGILDTKADPATVTNSALSGLISLKQQKERELVELRLMMITGEEAVAQLDQYIRAREARDTYFRGKPLWRLLAESQASPASVQQKFESEAAANRTPIIFLASLSGLFLLMAAVPRIIQFITAGSADRNTVLILLTLISQSSLLGRAILAVFTVLSVMVALALFVLSDWPGLAMGIQVVFVYMVLRLLLQAIILRFQPAQLSGPQRPLHWKPGWVFYSFSLLSAVVIVSTFGYIPGFAQGSASIILGFLFYSGWLVLLYFFCRHTVRIIGPGFWKYCNRALPVILLFLFFLELLGYRNFTGYLAGTAGYSFTIFCIALIAYDSIDLIIALLQNAAGLVMERFALTPIEAGPGAKVYRSLGVGLKVYVIIAATVLFFNRLSIGGNDNDRLMIWFITGWDIGGFTISPARVTLGLLLFILAWPAVEYLKQLIDRRWLSSADVSSSSRDTLLTLAGYAGYAAVIVLAVGAAGVRLTGLTVIIGALSVGIGFGLQNVVNNFISGLILMFERPIKKGDWIQVGTTEGYVKKISIRSTIVQTFDRSDVIVPNSELISNQVTNMMLDDHRGRLRVSVGVAYGSDTELVQQLLLEAAHAHDQVITDGSTPEPRALFQAFGDSSLNFDLLVHLKDIDNKLRVRSEMHTMIDKAFRAHGIEIPFPQRDIHIKSGATSSQER